MQMALVVSLQKSPMRSRRRGAWGSPNSILAASPGLTTQSPVNSDRFKYEESFYQFGDEGFCDRTGGGKGVGRKLAAEVRDGRRLRGQAIQLAGSLRCRRSTMRRIRWDLGTEVWACDEGGDLRDRGGVQRGAKTRTTDS